MNEIIEKYYQEEIESDSGRLMRGGIERNWGRLMRMLPKESDVALQDAAFNTIGDMVSEAARNGYETGFRAAFRFMMSL
ncbi:MAG: hypothetical protein IJ496_07780 [Ruminococcus sp.]|nr:hypothetical protein [Ruminococcus sp.]